MAEEYEIDRQKRKWIDAAEAREAWAQEHGCKDFDHAMQVGLQIVSKRRPGQTVDAPAAPARDVTIRDPALIVRAKERLGIRAEPRGEQA